MVVSDGSEPDHEHAMSSPKNVIRSDAESRVESEERAAETNDQERGNQDCATGSLGAVPKRRPPPKTETRYGHQLYFFCFLFVKKSLICL